MSKIEIFAQEQVTVSHPAGTTVEPDMEPKLDLAWTGRLGRNDLPGHLFDLYFSKTLPVPLAEALQYAWTFAEFPERYIERDWWICWLKETGYIGEPITTESVRLYRGSHQRDKENLAWTSNIETAQWFADRNNRLGYQSKIWTALVPASRILAHFPDDRHEDEYLVDAEGMQIIELGGAA